MSRVTVIPEDRIIVVDGVALNFTFSAPSNLHAVQWYDNQGHCEYNDGTPNKIIELEDYVIDVEPYVNLWKAEEFRIKQKHEQVLAELNKPENILASALAKAKAEREVAVNAITVEVDGMIFDGNEKAQERMTRAVLMADSPEETIEWVLHDNTVAIVTAAQLRRACRLAGQTQSALWTKPYTDVVTNTEQHYTLE